MWLILDRADQERVRPHLCLRASSREMADCQATRGEGLAEMLIYL